MMIIDVKANIAPKVTDKLCREAIPTSFNTNKHTSVPSPRTVSYTHLYAGPKSFEVISIELSSDPVSPHITKEETKVEVISVLALFVIAAIFERTVLRMPVTSRMLPRMQAMK